MAPILTRILGTPPAVKPPAAQRPDLIQRATDFLSTESFDRLAASKDPSTLQGPMCVAYGPLEAAPRLARPVVMVPGFTMEASSFDRMAHQLAQEPANGPVAVYVSSEHQFRRGSVAGPVMSGAELKAAKLFEIQYADPFTGPSVKAPQLAEALQQIQKRTGAADLDVVTHSEGGTDFRLYLDQRAADASPRFHQVVMVGPASHGTMVGNIGAVVGRVKNANVAAGELAVGSPLNRRLASGWAQQRAQAQAGVTLVRVTGAPTLEPSKGMFGVSVVDGDGFMPADQVPLPGATTVTLRGPHHTPAAHLWEVQYSGVINQAMKVLGGS